MNNIEVTVVVPVLNEERYIKGCLESLINQTYPREKMEWLFIDGGSTDKTVEICEFYKKKGPLKILHNSKKKTTYALNLGIESAQGKYVIRMDAHAEYDTDYIEKCVYWLEKTGADNVGGVAVTRSIGYIGEAIATMLSSRFGVGNSSFRVEDKSGFVDTVPFGAFNKKIFEQVGLFNHDLPRSEDNDMNARIRACGGRIWLSNEIKFTYYCRDSIGSVLKMGLKNGNALFQTLKINPKAMQIRHYIPFLFFLSILVLPIGTCFVPDIKFLLVLELGLYFLLDFYFSFKKKNRKYGFVTLWLYPMFHFVYGFGSFLGLIGINIM